MRKQIDIPDDVKMKLQILAVKAGKDLKNYIQDLLKKHVEDSEFQSANSWMHETG